MLYQEFDAIELGDLKAVCEFSTENSIVLSLRMHDDPGKELGWLDAHVTFDDSRSPRKVYMRLCIAIALSTLRRLNSIRQDFYRAIGLPDSVLFEMRVFATSSCVLFVDSRDGILGSSSGCLPDDTPVLGYRFTSGQSENE